MPVMKKPCVNDPSFTYTGKEMSPLGLGYSATAEKVGHFMKGKDNTMWMVGMKNGVKVWNRVPTELAGEVNAPLQKEEPVMQDVAGPSTEVPPPAPKKAPKKKTAQAEEKTDAPKKKVARKIKFTPEPEPEPVMAGPSTPEPEVEEITPEPEQAVAEPEPKPKKKAAPRKKSKTPETEEEEPKKEKKPRKPTDFNLFMKYHMLQLPKEIKHKEKFQMAAKAWKELDAEAKKEVMIKVHAEFAT